VPDLQLKGGEVDGLTLHYVVEGRGPAVVLVHGLGGFAESWRRTIAALAGRATVFAVDLPGHGASTKPRACYRLPFFARALHAFLDGVGVPRASLVGHSLGGAVAVTYALTHPARVERLALLAALVPGFPFQSSLGYRLIATPVLGEVLAHCACAPVLRSAIARCFHTPDPTEVDFLVRFAYATRMGADARAAWLATVRDIRADFVAHRGDYRRALATLDLPMLLVHGRQDRAVPPRHCAEVAEAMRSAEVRWLDQCGHFPQLEHADVVNGWLGAFLAGRPAPR